MTMLEKEIFCARCPNGCHLSFRFDDQHQLHLSGNQCVNGISFAKDFLQTHRASISYRKLIADEKTSRFSFAELSAILSCWQIKLARVHPLIMIEGSPERSLYRVVVEDDGGGRYILEQVAAAVHQKKERIAATLSTLQNRGLPFVRSYAKSSDGNFLVQNAQGLFQCAPFIEGVELDRENYIYEGWRAEPLAAFLVHLREASRPLDGYGAGDVFSLKDYIMHLQQQVRTHQPGIMPRVDAVITYLKDDFFPHYDQLPLAFCHGDYHPMNIIWKPNSVAAVIDWEFCGIKPEIYDAANMVGCLGMEHPSSLNADFVQGFLSRLGASGIFAEVSRRYFREFVIALRFAWLSEWLRKEDAEMVELELDYMELLQDIQFL